MAWGPETVGAGSQGLAPGLCSLQYQGSADSRACDLRPGDSFLEPQLLTQNLELTVRLTHVVLRTKFVPQGLAWALVGVVAMENVTSFPLVSEFLRQSQHTRVTGIAPKQVETQARESRGR